QLQAGNTVTFVFALAVVFVFLVLAAQYESWSLPLAVILVVPMCLLCSIVGVGLARMEVTVFTQIGFVVLVGLASKNAIRPLWHGLPTVPLARPKVSIPLNKPLSFLSSPLYNPVHGTLPNPLRSSRLLPHLLHRRMAARVRHRSKLQDCHGQSDVLPSRKAPSHQRLRYHADAPALAGFRRRPGFEAAGAVSRR